MFNLFVDKLQGVLHKIGFNKTLTQENIQEAILLIKETFLEADVAPSVIEALISNLSQKAIGQELSAKLKPKEFFIGLLAEELKSLFAGKPQLNLPKPLAVILTLGLQGAGKTTTAAKLAYYLKQQGRKVLLASADPYRAAAILQLERLAQNAGLDFYQSSSQDPLKMAQEALATAKARAFDVLIVDTAGRMHNNAALMEELVAINQALKPAESLFVADSMLGQDAANSAKLFNAHLDFTGIILSKLDSDTKAGAALSISQVTKKPIKFLGLGEKIADLELFNSERIISKLLGQGDLQGLLADFETKIDQAEALKMAEKLTKGKGFDLNDMHKQIQQLKGLGGMQSLMSKLPAQLSNMAQNAMPNLKSMERFEIILNSMTIQERSNPRLLVGSRLKRILTGSGSKRSEFDKLLKTYEQMKKSMKQFSTLGGMTGLKDMASKLNFDEIFKMLGK